MALATSSMQIIILEWASWQSQSKHYSESHVVMAKPIQTLWSCQSDSNSSCASVWSQHGGSIKDWHSLWLSFGLATASRTGTHHRRRHLDGLVDHHHRWGWHWRDGHRRGHLDWLCCHWRRHLERQHCHWRRHLERLHCHWWHHLKQMVRAWRISFSFLATTIY